MDKTQIKILVENKTQLNNLIVTLKLFDQKIDYEFMWLYERPMYLIFDWVDSDWLIISKNNSRGMSKALISSKDLFQILCKGEWFERMINDTANANAYLDERLDDLRRKMEMQVIDLEYGKGYCENFINDFCAALDRM